MIVITLTKVPASLRGDLTKWCQEIQTGVYVGNVSARIRDNLWDRICKNIGNGQASMAFNAKNEFGYQFRTTRPDYQVKDYDGIPILVHLTESSGTFKPGFSKAAQMHRARITSRSKSVSNSDRPDFVVIDLETTGLNASQDKIISIGAVKRASEHLLDEYYTLVAIEGNVPVSIASLTGITDELLSKEGVNLEQALVDLKAFVEGRPILGYNIQFDDSFLSAACESAGLPAFKNRMIDLLPAVKKQNSFLDNYKLVNVLSTFEIVNQHPHNALSDANATMELAMKLMKNGALLF